MKVLVTATAALAGLLIILIGGLTPTAFLIPRTDLSLRVIDLPSTLQVPALLFCSLVLGPNNSVIACFAYLTIGLFFLPVFHGGGSTGYLMTPDFGYLMGFIPAAWCCGNLSKKRRYQSFLNLTLIALIGVAIIHITGLMFILFGFATSNWTLSLFPLIFSYTLFPLPFQILLCPGIGLLARLTKIILIS